MTRGGCKLTTNVDFPLLCTYTLYPTLHPTLLSTLHPTLHDLHDPGNKHKHSSRRHWRLLLVHIPQSNVLLRNSNKHRLQRLHYRSSNWNCWCVHDDECMVVVIHMMFTQTPPNTSTHPSPCTGIFHLPQQQPP